MVLVLVLIYASVTTAWQQLIVKTKFDLDDTGMKDRVKLLAQFFAPRTAKLRMASLVFAIVFVIGAIATYMTATSATYPDPTWVYFASFVMVVGALLTLAADGVVTYVQTQMTRAYLAKVADGQNNGLQLLPQTAQQVRRNQVLRGAAYLAIIVLVCIGLGLALDTVLI